MSTKFVCWGLIAATALLFMTLFAAAGNALLVILALGLGAAWLAADVKLAHNLSTPFFVAFAGLAMVASLNDAVIPLTLLGLCADLAAWDVARFRARFAGETDRDRLAVLELRHLRLLAVTVSSGYLIALLPVYVHLAIPFVLVFGLTLLALLVLRGAARYLRAESAPSDQKLPR